MTERQEERVIESLESLASSMERMSAAGSSLASFSRTRGAGRKHDATTDHTTAPPFPGQGGGGVQRLVDQWNDEAEICDTKATRGEKWGSFYKTKDLRKKAAVLRLKASELETALRTEPLTQSEAGGVEECPKCQGRIIENWSNGNRVCHRCHHTWARGRRRERSGSGNDQGHRPSTKTK